MGFQNIDIKVFERCLQKQSKAILSAILSAIEGYQINIDGKVLRATGQRGEKTTATCIVSAWTSEYCLSLGQSKVDKKSNEKTAIPGIVETIDIRGTLVSIDAISAWTEISYH